MRTQRRSPAVPVFSYTPLAAAVALALLPQAAQATGPAGCSAGTTICVNSPGDTNPSGAGQFNTYGGEVDLRGAIANCTGGTIRFDLTDVRFNPSGGPFVIKPSLELPSTTCAIDGEGLSTDTASRVTVDGSAANSGTYPYGLPFGIASSVGASVNGLSVTNIGNGPGLSGVTPTNDIVSNSATGIETSNTVDTNRVFNNGTGITPTFSNQVVQNNVVYGNDVGIEVDDVSPTISNNTVGLGPLLATGNATGIEIFFGFPTVTGNVISNNDIGISIQEDDGATIESNLIGTDASGTSLRGNQVGIVLDFAYGTSIFGNTIAAPVTGTAIEVDDDSESVSIEENTINTNSAGTAMLGGGEGVIASCSFELSVDDNLITTNGSNAIDFSSMESSDISGNVIGATSFAGTTQLGAIQNGISLHDGVCSAGDRVASSKRARAPRAKFATSSPTDSTTVSDNTILNASANGIVLDQATNNNISSDNIITGSALYGVEVLAGTGNQIVENFIYGNGVTLGAGAKNIDLGFHGAGPSLPNDAGDLDGSSVPNDGQNYPAAISVHYDPEFDETRIDYTLDSLPGGYRIDFYENSPSTTIPGGTWFNDTFVTLPGPFSIFLGGQHSSISLTATSQPETTSPETSEFSPVVNTVLTPNVQISPSVLNFGDVGINTTSGPRTVTVRSSGTDAYQIGSYGDSTCYGGTICYGGAFSCTTNCTTDGSYLPGQSCSISVTFNPTSLGSFSDTIQFCDNAPNSPRSLSILGNGVIPAPLDFSPPSFDFGSVAVGHNSPPETFSVSNPGSTPVNIGVPAASGDYVVGNTNCGPNLNAGETCTVDVSFVPTTAGERDGFLSVATGGVIAKVAIHKGARFTSAVATDNGPPTAAATAPLTGNGVVAGALVLPDSVDFGAYALGAAALTRTVTLHNTGNANVKLTNISVSGPFTISNNCPASLAPDQSCTIALMFTSTALGSFTGSLVVTSDAAGGSGAIPITASAVGSAQPILQVSPTTIGFGSRMIGTSQGTQRITIKNVGSADAIMAPITFDGPDFTIGSNTCGATLAPANTCFADVVFMPLGFGQRKEHMTVNSNAANNPVSVELGGSGCRPFSITGGASSCTP
ncbi:MAG TPA: choice-of-anchor D domain-containing protein [Usitatibacter sp.]|nr:choice-of-anchor D domain-containing protein [Usitatibacter sp.]